jgi:hypothetical protein
MQYIKLVLANIHAPAPSSGHSTPLIFMLNNENFLQFQIAVLETGRVGKSSRSIKKY